MMRQSPKIKPGKRSQIEVVSGVDEVAEDREDEGDLGEDVVGAVVEDSDLLAALRPGCSRIGFLLSKNTSCTLKQLDGIFALA